MYEGRKVVALIPARGGSKGLPRKNILPLLGKPLIAWTIEQAKNSKYVDKVIVSTDDREIAEISSKYGAEIPFLRPVELATDDARGIDVVLHAIEFLYKGLGSDFVFLYLQPTSPLRRIKDIDNVVEFLFSDGNIKAVVSVTECEHHPLWANVLPKSLSMKHFLKNEVLNKNRQELPKYYRINGSIYAGFPEYIVSNRSFFGDSTFAYIMPRENSIDIDSYLDFKLAELLLLEKGKPPR